MVDMSLVDFLARCPVPLHLTGSRFFGTHRENSDWDFFASTEDLHIIHASLTEVKIECSHERTYGGGSDAFLMSVLRCKGLDIQFYNDRKTVTAKRHAQNILKRLKITKPTREQWVELITYCKNLDYFLAREVR